MWRIKAFITVVIICSIIQSSSCRGVSSLITLTESEVKEICHDFDFQYVAHPTNQQNYVICVPGGGIEKECPANQCFDKRDSRNAPCTTDCSSNLSPADQATKDYCNDDDTPLLARIANDKNCGTYFICLGKTIDPLPQRCPANQHFSEEKKTCLSLYEAKCAASSKWCKRERNGTRFPHINCHSYYECQKATTIVAQCPFGEHFSRDLGRCISGICQDDNRLPDCKVLNDGTRMMHAKCYKYFVCLKRSAYEVQCPSGYYFDRHQSSCVRDINNLCNDV